MKRFFALLSTGLLIGTMCASALAWEFSMTGEMEVRYRYFSRTGGGDLYGSANEAAVGFNDGAIGLSGYYGGSNAVVAQGYAAKGSDGAINDMRVWLYPEIRLNQAVRFRGEYWVTGGNLRGSYDGSGTGATGGDNWFINKGEQGWYIAAGPTSKVGLASGMWEKFWVTAQLPWGIFVAGRRGLNYGTGWATLDEKNTDSEMVALVVPYGPFQIMIGEQLYENNWIVPNSAEQLTTNATSTQPWLAAPTDKNGIRDINGAFSVAYRSGDIDAGTASRYVFHRNIHTYAGAAFSSSLATTMPAGPNRRDDASFSPVPRFFSDYAYVNGAVSTTVRTVSDVDIWQQLFYAKYNNGRFFFNGEYAVNIVDVFRQGGRPIAGWQDAWMVELGIFSGPAKLSLANFYKSGHDRRGGLRNTTSAIGYVSSAGTYVMDRWDEFMVFGGSNGPVKAYNYLMGLYGCGNNGFDAKGDAWYTDFLAYALRLDYAVAANLNVFGSYIYANRASNTGTHIGQYKGGALATTTRTNAYVGYTSGAQTSPLANVPDNYLGYEVDAGFDWKLLEGLTFQTVFAYWQPGDWFKWAYVDYTNNNTVTVSGVAHPVNPHRQIDPLIGFQGSMVINF
jgi:hypothetical protein